MHWWKKGSNLELWIRAFGMFSLLQKIACLLDLFYSSSDSNVNCMRSSDPIYYTDGAKVHVNT